MDFTPFQNLEVFWSGLGEKGLGFPTIYLWSMIILQGFPSPSWYLLIQEPGGKGWSLEDWGFWDLQTLVSCKPISNGPDLWASTHVQSCSDMFDSFGNKFCSNANWDLWNAIIILLWQCDLLWPFNLTVFLYFILTQKNQRSAYIDMYLFLVLYSF